MSSKVSFDVEREFFVIDSNNIRDVQTHLYGFSMVNDVPVTSAEDLGDSVPTGEGSYVFVSRKEDKITVMQDFIGSYGLYLYRDGDYYALSNSFLRLTEHVKQYHPITLNRDFATAFLSAGLCAISLNETLINEISLLDRNVFAEISIGSGNLQLHTVDYRENTVELSSAEGMKLLDQWYEKWTAMIRNLAATTPNIQVDLSGGFDTRLIITLLLGAGIDMNKIFVNSIQDELHTHKEDYEIASDIAAHYGFALNNASHLMNQHRFYTKPEILDISYYLKLGVHKQMYYRAFCFENTYHCFSGSGGECVRDYWNMTEEEYIGKEIRRCKSVFRTDDPSYEEAVGRYLRRTFNSLRNKHTSLGRPLSDEDAVLTLYRETRCRSHFGKDVLENMFGNAFKYTPLLDPQLHKLKLSDSSCKDRNLLMAIIFDRYNPDLLTFKVEGGRSIAPKTIAYAKALNRKFPYLAQQNISNTKAGEVRPAICVPPADNPSRTMDETVAQVKKIFYSSQVRGAFTMEYDPALYDHIATQMQTKKYQPLEDAHAVIAISKVIQDCNIGENLRSRSVAQYFLNDRFLSSSTEDDISLLRHDYLSNYITARVDIVNKALLSSKVELRNLNDGRAKITNPKWLDLCGNGYVVESQKGILDLDIYCHDAGKLTLNFRGRNVMNKNKKRVPFWIDLTAVTLDGQQQITQAKPIWHDKPLHISQKVSAGQTVHLHLEWIPHDECNNPAPKR